MCRLYVVNQPVDRERICTPSVLADGRTVYLSLRLGREILLNFYRATIESVLAFSICVWYAGLTEGERKAIDRVIKISSKHMFFLTSSNFAPHGEDMLCLKSEQTDSGTAFFQQQSCCLTRKPAKQFY